MQFFEKWHIMKIRNYIERLFVVVLLALVGVPAYADSFSVTYTPPRSNTSIYDVTNYSYYQKDNYFITHRIIEIDGDKVVTKGDANNVPDAEISKNDIIGKYYRKSKLLSFLIKNRFIIIGSILFLYMGVYILESNDKEDIDLKN